MAVNPPQDFPAKNFQERGDFDKAQTSYYDVLQSVFSTGANNAHQFKFH